MRDYHINIFPSDEDGGYIADIPDLPHCSAFGETPEEALAEVLASRGPRRREARASALVQAGHLPGGLTSFVAFPSGTAPPRSCSKRSRNEAPCRPRHGESKTTR
jgi:hypothetical protein